MRDRKSLLAEGLQLPSVPECPNPTVSHCHLVGSAASSRRRNGQFPLGFQRGTVGGRGQPVPGGLACLAGTPQPTQTDGHSPALRARFSLFAAVGKAEKKGTLGTASCPASQH